jgi:hypothetical protein
MLVLRRVAVGTWWEVRCVLHLLIHLFIPKSKESDGSSQPWRPHISPLPRVSNSWLPQNIFTALMASHIALTTCFELVTPTKRRLVRHSAIPSVHYHPMYTVSPDPLSTVGENSYGIRWGPSNRLSPRCLLLTDWHPRQKVRTCPVNCATSFLHSNSHLIFYKPTVHALQNYQSVLYVNSLRATSLTWLPASNPCGQYEHFFYWFIFLLVLKVCLCQAVVALHCMLHYQHFVLPSPFRQYVAKQNLFPVWRS